MDRHGSGCGDTATLLGWLGEGACVPGTPPPGSYVYDFSRAHSGASHSIITIAEHDLAVCLNTTDLPNLIPCQHIRLGNILEMSSEY